MESETLLYALMLILGAGVFLYFAIKKADKANEENKPSAEKPKQAVKPREEDAASIYEKVAKRQERASDLGVPGMILDFYTKSLQYFPSWIKNPDSSEGIKKLVPEAICLSDENNFDDRKLQITLKGEKYKIHYKTKGSFGEGADAYGDLKLYKNEKLVFATSFAEDFNEYGSETTPLEVNAFIEGSWINDFKELKEKYEKYSDENLKKFTRETSLLDGEKESPESLKKLKKKFGI